MTLALGMVDSIHVNNIIRKIFSRQVSRLRGLTSEFLP